MHKWTIFGLIVTIALAMAATVYPSLKKRHAAELLLIRQETQMYTDLSWKASYRSAVEKLCDDLDFQYEYIAAPSRPEQLKSCLHLLLATYQSNIDNPPPERLPMPVDRKFTHVYKHNGYWHRCDTDEQIVWMWVLGCPRFPTYVDERNRPVSCITDGPIDALWRFGGSNFVKILPPEE